MTEQQDNLGRVTAALVSLAESGIPVDVQELLVRGDPMRSIPAGALYRALVAAWICDSEQVAGKVVQIGVKAGLELAVAYHKARASECRKIAAVNKDNDLGADCLTHAIDHDIAADEIRELIPGG